MTILAKALLIIWGILFFVFKFTPHHPDPNMREFLLLAYNAVPVACLSFLYGHRREYKNQHGAGWVVYALLGVLLLFSLISAFSKFSGNGLMEQIVSFLFICLMFGLMLCPSYFLGRYWARHSLSGEKDA